MDIIQFAATADVFWQTFHDETLSREFAKALAEAQRSDEKQRHHAEHDQEDCRHIACW
jgi:thiamine phosphate synthase YjbQ (UPF0047 family)